MKYLIFYLSIMCCVFCSSCNNHRNKNVDLSQPNNVLYVVIGDTIINDTIIYTCKRVERDEFGNIVDVIHCDKNPETK